MRVEITYLADEKERALAFQCFLEEMGVEAMIKTEVPSGDGFINEKYDTTKKPVRSYLQGGNRTKDVDDI